jgi:hypothetical protein
MLRYNVSLMNAFEVAAGAFSKKALSASKIFRQQGIKILHHVKHPDYSGVSNDFSIIAIITMSSCL